MREHVCLYVHQQERPALNPLQVDLWSLPTSWYASSAITSIPLPPVPGISPSILSSYILQEHPTTLRKHRLGARSLGFESQLCHLLAGFGQVSSSLGLSFLSIKKNMSTFSFSLWAVVKIELTDVMWLAPGSQ